MRDRIYIAGFASESIETAKKYNYGIEVNHTCISENLNPENRKKTVSMIKEDLKRAGVWENGKYLVHGPFTELTVDAIDPRAVQLTWDRYLEGIEICQEIGANRMVVHSGFFPMFFMAVWHRKKAIEFFSKFKEELPKDFELLIENVFDDEPVLFKEVLEEIGSPSIKACIDIGHINALGDPEVPIEKWIETLQPYIGHYHVHNNYGNNKDTHSDIDEGSIDAPAVLSKIKQLTPNATITIESRNAEPSAAYLDSFFRK